MDGYTPPSIIEAPSRFHHMRPSERVRAQSGDDWKKKFVDRVVRFISSISWVCPIDGFALPEAKEPETNTHAQ